MSYRPLKICVLARTKLDAEGIIRDFIAENFEQIDIISRSTIVLKDGTLIRAFSVTQGKQQLDGIQFDQLFAAKDLTREMVLELRPVLASCMWQSCVPERYQIQMMER